MRCLRGPYVQAAPFPKSPQFYPGALQAVPYVTDQFLGKDDQLGETFQAGSSPEMPV